MPIDLTKYANEQAKKRSAKADSTTSTVQSPMAPYQTLTKAANHFKANPIYNLALGQDRFQNKYESFTQKYSEEPLPKRLFVPRNTEDDGVSTNGSSSNFDFNAITINAADGKFTKYLDELGISKETEDYKTFATIEKLAMSRMENQYNYDLATNAYNQLKNKWDNTPERLRTQSDANTLNNLATDLNSLAADLNNSFQEYSDAIVKGSFTQKVIIDKDGNEQKVINPKFYFDTESGNILSPKDWIRKNEDIAVRSKGDLNDSASDIEMEGGYGFSLWDSAGSITGAITSILTGNIFGLAASALGTQKPMKYEVKAKDKKEAGWRNFRTTEDKLDTYYGAKFAAVNKHMVNNLYRMSINNTISADSKGTAKQKMVDLVQQLYTPGIITKEQLSELFDTDKVLIRNGTTISTQNIEQFDMSKFNDLLSSAFQKGGANLNMHFFENNKSYFLDSENANSYFDNTKKGKQLQKSALNELPQYKGQYDNHKQTLKKARKGATQYMISQFGTINKPGSTEKYSESPAVINTIKDALVTQGNHIRTTEEAMQYLLDRYEKIEVSPEVYSYSPSYGIMNINPTYTGADTKYVLKDKKLGLASEINATPGELKSLINNLRETWKEGYNVSEEKAGFQIWQKLGAGLNSSTFIGFDGIKIGGDKFKDKQLDQIINIANANFNKEANTNGGRVYIKDGGYDASVSIQAFSPEESNLYGGNPIKYRDDLEMKKELNDFIKSIPEDEFISIDYSPVSSLKDFHAYVVRYGEDENVKQKTIYLKNDATSIDQEYFHKSAPEDFMVNLLHSAGKYDFSYLGRSSNEFSNASKFFQGPLLYERDLENGGYKLTSKFYDYTLDNYQKKSFPVPDFRTLSVDKIEERIINQIFAGINKGYTQVRGNK